MLCRFLFQNFGRFREETVLDLRAKPDPAGGGIACGGGERAFPVACISGPGGREVLEALRAAVETPERFPEFSLSFRSPEEPGAPPGGIGFHRGEVPQDVLSDALARGTTLIVEDWSGSPADLAGFGDPRANRRGAQLIFTAEEDAVWDFLPPEELWFTAEGGDGRLALYCRAEFQPYGPRPPREPFFIFCEGAVTEANYFGGFRRLIEREPVYRDMITIVPCASNTTQIVREAVRYTEKHAVTHGQIWCVFDKDDFPVQRFNGAAALTEKLSQENPALQYHAAWSNECIEFWFVLHFADYRSNNHREKYIRFLKDHLGSYKKNREDIFDVLLEQGDPKLAIRYARRILEEAGRKSPGDIAPGTTVYELAERLAEYLPEEIRGRFL